LINIVGLKKNIERLNLERGVSRANIIMISSLLKDFSDGLDALLVPIIEEIIRESIARPVSTLLKGPVRRLHI
jgi:hypothetical protein